MKRTAVLMSIGTRGDMEPFWAVAELLRARGWRVVGLFPEQFGADVDAMDVAFVPFDRAFLDLLHAADGKAVMGGQGSRWQRARSLYRMARSASKLSRQMMDVQRDVLQREDPELLLFHPKCLYGIVWAMAHPERSFQYSPVPVATHPVDHVGPTFRDDGRRVNRFLFRLTLWARALAIRKFSGKFFTEFPAVDFRARAIVRAFTEGVPSLYAVSPTLFPRPPYWPAAARITGFHERDRTRHWHPPPDLLAFLAAHERVILVTFGSMTNAEPAAKTTIIVNVLRRHGIAAILNCSEGGLRRPDGPGADHLYFVDRIPYDWVFPRLAAVVHHGGSGTTHTACKYGLPHLIVPHIVDQFFWNRTIARRGLGPLGPSIRELTEENFSRGVSDLLANEQYRQVARTVSEQMRKDPDRGDLYALLTAGLPTTDPATPEIE